MQQYIIPLKDIGTLPQETANQLFRIPTKYNHIDSVEFLSKPEYIKFNNIRALDDDKNIGRPDPHTQEQIQQLVNSFSQGVETWQELPCVIKNNVPQVSMEYDQVFGYGRVQALEEAGQNGHWFSVIKKASEYGLSWTKVVENLNLLPAFKLGEQLIIQQISRLIHRGGLHNTEDDIEKEILKILPTINKKSLNRVRNSIFETNKTPLRYQTWGLAKFKQWKRERCALEHPLEQNGNFDLKRKRHGYFAKNVLDPFHNAIMKYAKTSKKSYVILHVNQPNATGDLKTLRKNELSTLDRYKKSYMKLGLDIVPLQVLGFMPQDYHKEDMKYLVDVNGNSIK